MVKEDKKKEVKKIELRYYDVKIECWLPATVVYKVLAESPEQALEKVKYVNPSSVQHKVVGKRDLKVIIYEAGSSIIKFIKRLG